MMPNPLRVAFISRPTLFSVRGGDTVQMESTAQALRELGIEVDILAGYQKVDYSDYDLLHFFNLIRPANILYHLKRCNNPFVISPIFVDYSYFQRYDKKGWRSLPGKILSKWTMEYLKVLARYIVNKEPIGSAEYLLIGHKAAMQKILSRSGHILPNSYSEMSRLNKEFLVRTPYTVVPNAVSLTHSTSGPASTRDEKLILCVARIEGNKNQLNLIRAVKGTDFKLILIGRAAPNHQDYMMQCQAESTNQIEFLGELPHHLIKEYYLRAKVHAMPSWFETTGLSSLEAAAFGCRLVMGSNGDEKEYFGEDAFYCDPSSVQSIRDAILLAAEADESQGLKQKIHNEYNWPNAARKTLEAYRSLST
ncbi:MAG: glycosyltransferase [Bacteroidetes bacterium]|nr:glycosyltransferase [Bacteroidota bacterium]